MTKLSKITFKKIVLNNILIGTIELLSNNKYGYRFFGTGFYYGNYKSIDDAENALLKECLLIRTKLNIAFEKPEEK